MVVNNVAVEERGMEEWGLHMRRGCWGRWSWEKKLAENVHDKAVDLYEVVLWKIVMKFWQLICLSAQSMDFQEVKVDGCDWGQVEKQSEIRLIIFLRKSKINIKIFTSAEILANNYTFFSKYWVFVDTIDMWMDKVYSADNCFRILFGLVPV